jgi:adenylosuccinate synthase
LEKRDAHGTCGLGVGQTYQREEDYYSLLAGDLYYPSVAKMKLDLLRQYYNKYYIDHDAFMAYCFEMTTIPEYIQIVDECPHGYCDNKIFEGSQGLLLDQEIGFFPHVTRGFTGSKNILKFNSKPKVYLVTRAYQTRHGNGPMTNEHLSFKIPDNPEEHNSEDGMQGRFRKAILDLDLVEYAISRDQYISSEDCEKSLVITCLDVLQCQYTFTKKGKIFQYNNKKDFINNLLDQLSIYFYGCYVSCAAKTEKLQRYI